MPEENKEAQDPAEERLAAVLADPSSFALHYNPRTHVLRVPCARCACWQPDECQNPTDPKATGECRKTSPRRGDDPDVDHWPQTWASDWCMDGDARRVVALPMVAPEKKP